MIKKYTVGKPIKTEAVVRNIECETEPAKLVSVDGDKIRFTLEKEDIIYGLGQAVRGIDKRGYIYRNICSDEPNHTEDRMSLYAAHNFIMVSGEKKFALFIDCASAVTFDLAYTKIDEVIISFDYPDYDLYIIEGESLNAIIKEFRALIGKSYIPPKWAFGYGQSRWSYTSADEVREVVRKHRENDIPLDSVYLDIDHMDLYKDFTVNEDAFPNFEEFVSEMKREHIHIVPIIDAGIKIEKGYDLYDEGVANDYFCKDEKGEDMVCAVWPGEVHFPDFLKAETREWFGKKYDYFISKGVDGFWNDMNEPTIFYTRESLENAFETLEKYKDKKVDVRTYFILKDAFYNLLNNHEDYKLFYNNYDGELYRHDRVHNLYGYNMTKAASEYFQTLDKDILMFSRASYIGAHRYGGIWQGDNHSWWSHLKLNLQMTMSLNMVGFLFTGADIGGFSANTTPQLMLRWLEFGIFTPLMRNHSAIFTRRQEVYNFDNIEDMKNIIKIRYGLLGYIYEQFKKSVENDEMYMRPLAFDFEDDERAKRVEDQALVGDSIMIAPVYEQNATGRFVYLPEKMKMLKMSSLDNIKEEVLEKGNHYIDVALNEVLIFIRKGKSLELSKGGMYVSDEIEEGKVVYSNL